VAVAPLAAEHAVTLFFVVVPPLAANGQLIVRDVHGDVVLRQAGDVGADHQVVAALEDVDGRRPVRGPERVVGRPRLAGASAAPQAAECPIELILHLAHPREGTVGVAVPAAHVAALSRAPRRNGLFRWTVLLCRTLICHSAPPYLTVIG